VTQFRTSPAVTVDNTVTRALSSASLVRALACRPAIVPFAQPGLIGERSGEYGGQ
jgi:hypothetical protein